MGRGERKKIQLTSGRGGGVDGTFRMRESTVNLARKSAARIVYAPRSLLYIILCYNYYDDDTLQIAILCPITALCFVPFIRHHILITQLCSLRR